MSQRAVHPEPAAALPAAVRILAIADTDSYLKWSATTLDTLPSSWESSQLLIENPVMPSEAQIRAASKRPVEVVSHAPALIISDFGVSAEMIKVVFERSGCLWHAR